MARCDRTPSPSTQWNGRWYWRLFSRANSHWTTPTDGREVIHGTPTDENGAPKSSTTSSDG